MIIDCDTHFLPPDTYDYMGPEWEEKRLRFAATRAGRDTAAATRNRGALPLDRRSDISADESWNLEPA